MLCFSYIPTQSPPPLPRSFEDGPRPHDGGGGRRAARAQENSYLKGLDLTGESEGPGGGVGGEGGGVGEGTNWEGDAHKY